MKLANSNKLTFQLDLFNIFNSQQVLEWNETPDYSRGTSPFTDPDTGIFYPGQLSQNYQSATGFQAPRSGRLTARYEF